MILLFQRHVERGIAEELKRDGVQLIAGLQVGPDGSPRLQRQPTDPRFSKPLSGLYWQVTGARTLRSRSLWDQLLPTAHEAPAAEWRLRKIEGPFERPVLVLERRVQIGKSVPLLVQLAHDDTAVRHARAEFARELAVFMALLWTVLLAAAWLQVRLGLRPFRRVREELAALRRHPSARMGGQYPSEVRQLTDAINDLASARESDLKRARQRAADLAHALKTPLAALAAQSRRIRGAGNTEAADGLDRVIGAAGAAVEAELARARAAASRLAPQAADAFPLAVAERIAAVLERTEKGMRTDCELDIPEGLRISVPAEDLSEILGTLLENAVKFARRRVLATGGTADGKTWLCIEDDGPGIAETRQAEALTRGGRLDEVGGGHGLGLAIARELTEATGGSLALDISPLGGLRVTLRW
ncbi:sensor histidine kinase [Iodidimonas sp. SYSU 1G8]|uniref:sensor histidine kinase n=1 Tax=Iodidimonas sp. SYSU 1G8 TaxID=3133967 RepID=UPI0031FF1930